MSECITPFLCDTDLLLERITHSASQTEKVIRASTDPIEALGRIIEANDVVFVLWNGQAAQDSTGYSVLKGRDILEKIKAGDVGVRLAFNSHPLNALHDSLSAVGTYGTAERAAILTDARTPFEAVTADYMSRM